MKPRPELEQLTTAQLCVYNFVRGYTETHGMPPSVREIMDNFGWASTNAVTCHLKAMEKKGVMLKANGRARAWRCAL